MSSKKCQVRAPEKSVMKESYRSVKQGKSVPQEQECHQCVKSGCPTISGLAGKWDKTYCFCSSTYVSAFGFVGFILFFWFLNVSDFLHSLADGWCLGKGDVLCGV